MAKIRMCDPKLKAKDLTGKVYIVTGANSGVGFETSKQLVKQGATVVMSCRRVSAGEEAAKELSGLNGSYRVMALDLCSNKSVRAFVEEFKKEYTKLDGLVCNAGMVNMKGKLEHTEDGYETTMAASFFGHFLLTELLLEILESSAPSRMLILSSCVHAGSPSSRYDVNFEDINWNNRKYDNFAAYGEAKVACNLYALELAERLKDKNVFTCSIHPGWARSNFGSGAGIMFKALMCVMGPIVRMMGTNESSEEAAQTSLYCLLSDEALQHSGAYFSQRSVLYSDKECRAGGWPMESPNPNAKDPVKAKKLVELAKEMVNL